MSARPSRRTVLRGMMGGAAISVALPMLDIFRDTSGTARAADSAFPRRFGLFFWGNGMLPKKWIPTGVGAGNAWQLSEQLMPLSDHKDQLTVVSGMEVVLPNSLPHGAGPGGILAGAPIIRKGGDEFTFSAPSIDQILASEHGHLTRFRSIEAGVQPGVTGRSFNGPDSKNPPEPSPRALFRRLFGPSFVAPGDDPIIDPRLALRRSVLDAVMEDSKRLQQRVGRRDQTRLEQHFDGVRDLEVRLRRLEEDPPSLASCEKPERPPESFPGEGGRPPLADINIAMAKLLAMSLACDQTRVFSLWFSEPVGNVLYPNASAGHHQLTHNEPGDQPEVNQITKQIMRSFADLLTELRAIPEGDGSLLDNCAVLATSDVSLGRQHELTEYPVLIAGSAGGSLRTNYHHRAPNDNVSKVLVTLLRSQGMNVNEFGVDTAWVDQGVSEIEAWQ